MIGNASSEIVFLDVRILVTCSQMIAGQSLDTFLEFATRFAVEIQFSKDQYRQFEEGIPVVLASNQFKVRFNRL